MAKIDFISSNTNLKGRAKPGLIRQAGKQSELFVGGEGLDNLTLYVTEQNASRPSWQGALSSTGIAGRWKAFVVYNATSDADPVDVQLGGGDGDPADVPVTVTAGTTPTNSAATLSTGVQVGQQP